MERERRSGITQDHARPLPVASMHVQTAPNGGSQRLPFGTGQLEVMRIQRFHNGTDPAGKTHAGLGTSGAIILLDGIPASSHSTSREGLLVFVEGREPPLARVDHDRRSITAFYPLSEYERISQLLRTGSRRLCYCWRAADSTRSVVMLMAMG